VIGRWPSAHPDAPTVLVYGHFDVQPSGAEEDWTSAPFEPDVRDGRIYARGATDDKGNMLAPIRAARALEAAGGLPVNLVLLFEGEEEIGSPSLPALLEQHREQLRVDVVLSADGVMLSDTAPTVMLSFKGLISLELRVRTAAVELHSGLHAGFAPNAALALSQLLASMVAPDGSVLVDRFDAGATALDDNDRAQAAALPFEVDAYRAATGVTTIWGEPGYTPRERNWFRPTLDVNGIWGGFQGEGTKTVVPAIATAKITCRIAPGQSPESVIASLRAHIERHSPAGAASELVVVGGVSGASAIRADDPTIDVVREALRDAYGVEPTDVRTGASLPVASMLMDALGLPTVMLGWCLPDERMHAPDEFLRLENFDRGPRVYADVLTRLAAVRP
jgi:acetylornithine deacetylase/succinyl-diaminopimelate desuccinylase-like protein